jgi:hypothetical protein
MCSKKKLTARGGLFTLDVEYGYGPVTGQPSLRCYYLLTLAYPSLGVRAVVRDLALLANTFGLAFRLYTAKTGLQAFLVSRVVPSYSRFAARLYARSRAGYPPALTESGGYYPDIGARLGYVCSIGPAAETPRLTRTVDTVVRAAAGRRPALPVPSPGSSSYAAFLQEVVHRRPLTGSRPPLQNCESGFAAVERLAPYYLGTLQRPQVPLLDRPQFFLALDALTKTVYVSSRQVLMVDVDTAPATGEQEYLRGLDRRCREKGVVAAVYRTRRGYHLFLVDRARAFRSRESVDLALQLGGDLFYCVYSYLRGWCVRVSPKPEEDPLGALYRPVGLCGDARLVRPGLLSLVKWHEHLSASRDHLLRFFPPA